MVNKPTSSLQNLGIAIEIACPALAFICVCIRIYYRLLKGNHGWDDALIVVAMALSIALAVGSIKVMKLLYIGIHYWNVPRPFDPTPGMKWIYVVGAVYNPILAIVKQSVLVFLLRLASTEDNVRYAIWALSIFNIAEMIAVFLVVIFQCHPIAANWDLTLVPVAKCINRNVFGLTTGGLTILTDLCTLAIPIYIFSTLHVRRKTKFALIVVFMLGTAVTVVSIVRLYFLHQNFVNHSPDARYSLGFCVSSIECNLAIITACGPALWPILRGWLPRGFTDVYRSGSLNVQRIDIQLTPSSGKRVQSDSGIPMDTEASTLSQERFMESRRSNGRCKTCITGNRHEDSDEEVLMHESAGIVRTMDYTVVHEDRKDALRRTDTF